MYQTFWNYQQKKSGEIIIAKEEIQKMLDQAYQTGYNQAFVEQYQMVMESTRVSVRKETRNDSGKHDNMGKISMGEASEIFSGITGAGMPDDSSMDESSENEPITPMMPPQLPDEDDLMSDLDL